MSIASIMTHAAVQAAANSQLAAQPPPAENGPAFEPAQAAEDGQAEQAAAANKDAVAQQEPAADDLGPVVADVVGHVALAPPQLSGIAARKQRAAKSTPSTTTASIAATIANYLPTEAVTLYTAILPFLVPKSTSLAH